MASLEPLPSFVIPLQKSNLVLPSASVAEIIPYEPLRRLPDTPDWFRVFFPGAVFRYRWRPSKC